MPAHVTYFNAMAERHSWLTTMLVCPKVSTFIPDNIRAFYKMKVIVVAIVVGTSIMILPVREITKGKTLSQGQQLKSAARIDH